jgi:hypothetical protein
MLNRSKVITIQLGTIALLSVSLTLVACEDTDSDGGNSNTNGGSNAGDGSQNKGGSKATDSTANTNNSSSPMAGTSSGSGGTSGTVKETSSGGTLGGAGTSSPSNDRSRCKRGIAYGFHSDADLTVLSPKVVWWYNWHFAPDNSLSAGLYKQLDVEYVPMVWGPKIKLSDVESQLPDSATTLLGYNEPNFFAQANVSAADAAKQWPTVQAIADKKGLRLVSPAVNYCGGGCFDTDPFSYLEAFFKACTSCRVDVIAVHIYVGCRITSGNHAQWLIDHLKRYQTEFSQPIWLTEFACNDARNVAEQKAFLEDAVAYLEATPRIERYAWFAGRADNVPYVDLLGASGQLTELGQAYVNAQVNVDCKP